MNNCENAVVLDTRKMKNHYLVRCATKDIVYTVRVHLA